SELDANFMLAPVESIDGITDLSAPANMAVGVTDQFTDAHGDAMVFIATTLKGDADMNGEVGLPDYLIMLNNFARQDANWDNADFDRDGEVGLSDYLALLNNFARNIGPLGAPSAPAITSVPPADIPEPATFTLLGAGALTFLRRRKD